MSDSQLIAQEIISQLGGNKFRVMTGAKDFLALNDGLGGLQCKLPSNFALKGINVLRIILDPSDTYRVEFGKLRGLTYKKIAEFCDVYCEMLADLVSEQTGLDLSL